MIAVISLSLFFFVWGFTFPLSKEERRGEFIKPYRLLNNRFLGKMDEAWMSNLLRTEQKIAF